MSHPIGEPPPVTSFVPACSGSAPQREAPQDSRRMTAGFMLAGHPVGGEEARAAACRVAPCRSRSRPGEAPRRGPAGVARREQLIEARPRVQRVILEPGRVVPGQVRGGIGAAGAPPWARRHGRSHRHACTRAEPGCRCRSEPARRPRPRPSVARGRSRRRAPRRRRVPPRAHSRRPVRSPAAHRVAYVIVAPAAPIRTPPRRAARLCLRHEFRREAGVRLRGDQAQVP